MQPSPAWKSDYIFSPLEEPEAHDAPEAPAGASTIASPNIATLAERFKEPLRQESGRAPAPAKPAAALGQSLVPPRQENGVAQTHSALAAPPPKNPGLAVGSLISRRPAGGLVAGLAGVALVPMSFFFFLWWQDTAQPPQQTASAEQVSAKTAPVPAGSAQPEQSGSALDAALSSPDRVAGDAGEVVAFPIAIDSAAALPARSIVAISSLPEGASFSQGHPYGDTGWSLGADETAGLRLQLPAQSDTTDIRLELIAGDGTMLAQSATQLSIAPPQVAANEGAALGETASADETGSIAPPPQEPSAAATAEPDVTVTTVKTVTVEPPRETVPHDGAMALGSPADAPQGTGEWMVTKTAVDMHARAEQKSETVKIAQGGIKVRVTGRDRNWIQVHDPASGTTGWIYNRFLTPTEPPAE
jgi:hypothetical protein